MIYEDFFRGYVSTKNKRCTMQFKNKPSEELLSLDEAEQLPEYAAVLDKDTVLVDVDNAETSEILLNIIEAKEIRCRVYETTRGKHFFFKNDGSVVKCGSHINLACGIEADIKVGSTNSYAIRKYNNKTRDIIYDKLENEEYDTIPKWLLPIRHNQQFRGMESGDGRNQSLFNYILRLQSAGFNRYECKETIHIINDYVFTDKLSEQEVEIILRDEAFEAPSFFNDKGVFLFEKFAVYIANEYHIVRINDALNIYKDGVYTEGDSYIERSMIKHIPHLTKARRSEVLSYLQIITENKDQRADADWIAFANGLYNIATGEFRDFTPDIYVTNKIPHNYNPDAYSEVVDKTLDKLSCGDKEIRYLLEECVGYCFYRRNELRKSFLLIGGGSNGKSTYIRMIQNCLGWQNTTAVDLEQLGDRFKTIELYQKLACLGDDISDEFIRNDSAFKKLTSGDIIMGEQKGKNPIKFNNYAKLFFSCNNIPRIKDNTQGLLSRLIIIPFKATFSKDDADYDPYIIDKLCSEQSMEYLIQLGLDGLYEVINKRCFTESEAVQKEKDEYERYNNPVKEWIDFDEPNIIGTSTDEVYEQYLRYCTDAGLNAMSKSGLSRYIKNKMGLTTTNIRRHGKQMRVYAEIMSSATS